jgi:uncharacterized membrane protein
MGIQRKSKKWMVGWSLAFVGSTVLLVLATMPAFVGDELRSLLMLAFSGACHQIAERSPHLAGVQLAVCHRCYGIYLALPLAALAFLYLRRWDAPLNSLAPVLICVALLVPGVDWLGDVFGLWRNTAPSRLLTGAFFGLVAGYFLSRALAGLFESPERSSLGATIS